MLTDLKQYESFGSLQYLWELMNLFYDRPDVDWTVSLINAHFYNRIIDGETIFDGGIALLKFLRILEFKDDHLSLSKGFESRIHDRNMMRARLLEKFFEVADEQDILYKFFSAEYCSYDLVNNRIQVSIMAVELRYSSFRKLLIELRFLLAHPDYPERAFIVNPHHQTLFDKYITTGIRIGALHPDKLQAILAAQLESGMQGETFVMDYEKRRLNRNDIIQISNYDASAGYDILSYERLDSLTHDRFIEVKTFCGSATNFYWSRGEMRAAEERELHYYLYIVNLDKIHKPEYIPLVIQNPYPALLNTSDWSYSVEKYHFTMINE